MTFNGIKLLIRLLGALTAIASLPLAAWKLAHHPPRSWS